MEKEDLDALWKDPKYWTQFAYKCKLDPRLIVPKRNPVMGWTINFGHPNALPAVLGIPILALIAPVSVAIAEYPNIDPVHMGIYGIGISLVLTVTACILLSRPPKNQGP